jgi:transposase
LDQKGLALTISVQPLDPARIVDHAFVTLQLQSSYGDVEKHMYFDELSNDEWALLQPMISDQSAEHPPRRGRPRAKLRVVVNAVLWVMTTGESWSRLPCGYPSGPTCRCRFEEWRLNGTLLAMVTLLSKHGRTFTYVPTPSSNEIVRALPHPPRFLREDGGPQVLWKSADAWQTSSGVVDRACAATPFSEITRQLSGRQNVPANESSVAAQPVRQKPRLPRTEYSQWMGLHSHGAQVSDPRGYVIYAAVDRLEEASFRGWAEIVKNGRRVARSGLVGPRLANAEDAQHYAIDWARKWIDRHCPTPAIIEVANPVRTLNTTSLPQPVARDEALSEQDEYYHESVRW